MSNFLQKSLTVLILGKLEAVGRAFAGSDQQAKMKIRKYKNIKYILSTFILISFQHNKQKKGYNTGTFIALKKFKILYFFKRYIAS